MAKPKILLIDIETAPTKAYIWDLFTRYVPHSQVVEPGYTICWAAQWYGQKKMMFKSIHHDSTEEMIKEAHKLLDEADVVVHFNGTKFDIPKLNAEFLRRKMGPPAPFIEVDLYKTAKGRFKLLSNSMSYVAKTLGIKGKLSHKGMSLWTECMAGNTKSWAKMKAYNIQDVRMLSEIYDRLLPWIQPHPNLALWNEKEVPQCGRCGSENVYIHPKIHTTQTMVYHRIKCRDCGSWSRTRKNLTTKGKKDSTLVGIK